MNQKAWIMKDGYIEWYRENCHGYPMIVDSDYVNVVDRNPENDDWYCKASDSVWMSWVPKQFIEFIPPHEVERLGL